MKTCSVCEAVFPYDKYYKTVSGNYYSYCKKCYSKKVKIRMWIEKGWDIEKAEQGYYKNRLHIPNINEIYRNNALKGGSGKTRNVDPNKLRVCTKCGKEQPYENYYTTKNKTSSGCKTCMSHYNKTVRNKRRRMLFKTDPNFKIAYILRARFRNTLKKKIDSNDSSVKLLGCTLPEARNHIEKQFKRGMSWKNYGKWHIDHIIPISKFDLTTKVEVEQCWHFTNLQPLWAKDNIAKGCRVTDSQFKILM